MATVIYKQPAAYPSRNIPLCNALIEMASQLRRNLPNSAQKILRKTSFGDDRDFRARVESVFKDNYLFRRSELTYRDKEPIFWRNLARADVIDRLRRLRFPEDSMVHNAKAVIIFRIVHPFLASHDNPVREIRIDQAVFEKVDSFHQRFQKRNLAAQDVQVFLSNRRGRKTLCLHPFPNLETIDFSLSQIADDELVRIIRNCKKLQRIILSGGAVQMLRGAVGVFSEGVTAQQVKKLKSQKLEVALDFSQIGNMAVSLFDQYFSGRKWRELKRRLTTQLEFFEKEDLPELKGLVRMIALRLKDSDLPDIQKGKFLYKMVKALEIGYMAMRGCYPQPAEECSGLEGCLDFLFPCCRKPIEEEEFRAFQLSRLGNINLEIEVAEIDFNNEVIASLKTIKS